LIRTGYGIRQGFGEHLFRRGGGAEFIRFGDGEEIFTGKFQGKFFIKIGQIDFHHHYFGGTAAFPQDTPAMVREVPGKK
jgi:hypothetical protein